MTYLVTGGSGFLGSHVVEQLSRAGHSVRALVRRSSDTRFLKELPGVELVYGAVEDSESLAKALQGVRAVVHSAGLVKARSEQEFFQINARGSALLCDGARAAGVERFVLVSSLAVVGPTADGSPVPDDCEPKPVTAYGRSKRQAEREVLARKDSLSVVIVRPAAIYGPRDREILAFFRSIKFGVLPLIGRPSNKLSMIYGPDCAAACIAATHANVPSGTTLFVDDGVAHPFEELVTVAEAALGRRAFLRLPLPERLVRAAALGSELFGRASNRAVMFNRDKCNELLNQWVCDATRTRQLLDWKPEHTFSEGIRATVAWYKQAGWL